MKKILIHILFASLVAILVCSCEKDVVNPNRRALVVMGFGFNNLSAYISEDLGELESGYVPQNNLKDNLLFVMKHTTEGQYSTKTAPVLYRLYKDKKGKVVKEEIFRLEEGALSNSGECIGQILNYIKDHYKFKSCGVVLSSHGTGWTPPGYCTDPSKYENSSSAGDVLKLGWSRKRISGGIVDYAPITEGPAVKSFGGTVTSPNGKEAYETELREFADGIPYKLDYIIFDACFMGCVEVAYELKDKCRWFAASQTEIMADGMNYRTMAEYLLAGGSADVKGFCKSYYDYYEAKSGINRSATISLIDCSRLEGLASVCKEVFSGLSISTETCNSDLLQRFYRSSYRRIHGWFYDLQSILEVAGADDSALTKVENELSKCVMYKAATEQFMNDFYVDCFCGLSMYLPYPERNYLNNYYKELAWNQATGLVK